MLPKLAPLLFIYTYYGCCGYCIDASSFANSKEPLRTLSWVTVFPGTRPRAVSIHNKLERSESPLTKRVALRFLDRCNDSRWEARKHVLQSVCTVSGRFISGFPISQRRVYLEIGASHRKRASSSVTLPFRTGSGYRSPR